MRALLAASALVAGACSSSSYVPAADPAAPFSNAVQVEDTLYLAGHLGLDPQTHEAPGDPAVEARLLLDAFAATLQRAGMSMSDLVMVEVHCTDLGLYDLFNTAYRARFHGAFPARAFLGAAALLRGCRFEMLGVAVRR